MIHLAQTALALDGNDPEVLHWASWIIALPGGDLSGGITLINKSIDLNPNNAAALQKAGCLYAFAGDKQSADRVPGGGVGAVGKWPAAATAESLA